MSRSDNPVFGILLQDGSFNTEVQFQMYDASGTLVLGCSRVSSAVDLIVNGVTYSDGDLFYTGEVPQGNDYDDSDPAVKFGRQ